MIKDFELQIETNTLTSATIPIIWKYSDDFQKSISDDAEVLIVAVDELGRESRTLAPFTQRKTFLNINRAGINKIYAIILFGNKIFYYSFKKMFLSKESYHCYYKHLFF